MSEKKAKAMRQAKAADGDQPLFQMEVVMMRSGHVQVNHFPTDPEWALKALTGAIHAVTAYFLRHPQAGEEKKIVVPERAPLILPH